MFKPYPYDDPQAINRPELPQSLTSTLVAGNVAVAKVLAAAVERGVLALDGYVSAQFEAIIARIKEAACSKKVVIFDVAQAYKIRQNLRTCWRQVCRWIVKLTQYCFSVKAYPEKLRVCLMRKKQRHWLLKLTRPGKPPIW